LHRIGRDQFPHFAPAPGLEWKHRDVVDADAASATARAWTGATRGQGQGAWPVSLLDQEREVWDRAKMVRAAAHGG
jgi:hypothetical protein